MEDNVAGLSLAFIVVFIIHFICAYVAREIATSKHRSEPAWVIFTLLTGVLGVFLVFCIPPRP